MAKKVRAVPDAPRSEAAYRADAYTPMLDEQLKGKMTALVHDTRKKVARAYDLGSITSLAIAGETLVNWDASTYKSVALTFMALAALMPQVLKRREYHRLDKAEGFKQLLSIHAATSNVDGNHDAQMARLRVMSGENEGRTDERNSFYEFAGVIGMVMTLLRIASELQTSDIVGLESMVAALSIFLVAGASAFVVDKRIKKAKGDFRRDYAELQPNIAGQTRVAYDALSAENHDTDNYGSAPRSEAAEKRR